MAEFPAYANVLFNGFAERPESGVLTTEMEDGPAKVRRTKSRVMVRRPVTVQLLSKTDYLLFLDWFRDSEGANRGAAWFDWLDPVTGTTRQARIVGGSVESQPLKVGLGIWNVALVLESWDA